MHNDVNYIIKKILDGSIPAQRALYDIFRHRWYSLCLRYAQNKYEADDLFQNGLIEVYNSLHTFNSKKAGFYTWSTRVIINTAIKHLKKHNWQNSFLEIDEARDQQQNSFDPIDNLSNQEVNSIIQKLPMGYRLVFNLFAIEGYSHIEIAEKLGIEVGTSKSQLFKARKILKEQLETILTD